MYCANCGQELNNDAKFCFRCGTKIQEGTQQEHQDDKYEQSSIFCPKCELYDKIEKVSSIVKSQTRTREKTEWITETYTDNKGKEQSFSYPRSYDVVEITDLAKHLSPPQKPQAKNFSGCLLILGILGIGSGLLGVSLFLLLVIMGDSSFGGMGGGAYFG